MGQSRVQTKPMDAHGQFCGTETHVLKVVGELIVTIEYCVQLLKRFYVRGCWDAYKVRAVLCGDGSSAEPEFQRSLIFRAGEHCKVERCKVCSRNQVVCKLRGTVYEK